jgi:O-antigen/teichoic acid export membrane protein
VLLVSIFINPIMTPVFSSIRNDMARVNDALIRATTLLAILGFPLCVAAALCGKEVMTLIYGTPYGAAGAAFSVLFAGAFVRTIASPVPAVYIGLGRPELNRKFAFVRTMLCIALMYPAARFGGMTGAAAAVATAMAVSWFFQSGTLHALTGLTSRRYRGALLTGLPGTLFTLAGGALSFLAHGPRMRIGTVVAGCCLGLFFSINKIMTIFAPKDAPKDALLTNGVII